MDYVPNWVSTISSLFSQPYWVDATERDVVGQGWIACMKPYAVDLSDYASVRQWSTVIYSYLHSREMPLGADPSHYWPDAALEAFRVWVNLGWPRAQGEPLDPSERIPVPEPAPVTLAVRRDIRSMTLAELDDYRMRVDDVFQVASAAPDAPGQIFFKIHGDWCLHYQEAFLLWHRAYLMRFEQEIGCPVPYWNWYAKDAAIDESPDAGLPQAFKDLTYTHPKTGETRPNPLRFAAAFGGVSKACRGSQPKPVPDDPPVNCHFVQRDPVLYTTGNDHEAERRAKIALTGQYQQQVFRALQFTDFSTPEGAGFPWANIPSFNPPPPDSEYVYRDVNFDGAYEQPHDNYHGWVGPDMADNAYTAFDPVFWSYHANIDRIFESWLRANPAATFTSNFPLHPFAGTRADRFEFNDPRQFIYTTIGDLAKDSRGLGYDFGVPVSPDFEGGPIGPATIEGGNVRPAGADIASAPAGRIRSRPHDSDTVVATHQADATRRAMGGRTRALPPRELLIRFEGVRCTFASYAVDAFINQDGPVPADVRATNPHYVGRFSRIGMGLEDDKGRCIKRGVTRLLDATNTARRLGLGFGEPCRLSLLVTELPDGHVVPPEVYATLPGFIGEHLWFEDGRALRSTAMARDAVALNQGCCHSAPA